MYCASDYQVRVLNVSKRFSSIEPNKLYGETILGVEKCPDNAIEAFFSCNAEVFPNIKFFLQILSTMPVGVASAERSFSTLRRMKTWLRSRMGETRLTEEKLKCFQKSANDPDAQFLMSLLPFLKDIPKHRKLMVRAKLQQVLMDEQHSITSAGLYENSSDSSQYSVFQQLPEDDLTRYVTQFNPNNNN
ncbi:hypothetical protein QTP88_015949 [Uroleucon formosanum]